jgi:hypothetical protein
VEARVHATEGEFNVAGQGTRDAVDSGSKNSINNVQMRKRQMHGSCENRKPIAWLAAGTLLLTTALCYVDTLAAQSNGERGSEPPEVVTSETYFLGPPNNDGPVVVGVAFQLKYIV